MMPRVLRCRVCNQRFVEDEEMPIDDLFDRLVLHEVKVHKLDASAEIERVEQEARARGWLE